MNPAPRGADTADLALGVGKRVPGSEPRQPADVGFDPVRGDGLDEVVHPGIPGWGFTGLDERCRRLGQGQQERNERKNA